MPRYLVFAVLLSRSLPWILLLTALALFGNIVAELNAGQSRQQVWVELMTNVTRTRGFAFVFGLFSIVYGLRQRADRLASEKFYRSRIDELESGRGEGPV